jgi:hypothetical protein
MKEVYVHFYWTSSSKIKYDIGKSLSVRCDEKGQVYYSDLMLKLRQIYSEGEISFPRDSKNMIKFCEQIC